MAGPRPYDSTVKLVTDIADANETVYLDPASITALPPATHTTAGVMTAADKVLLDALVASNPSTTAPAVPSTTRVLVANDAPAWVKSIAATASNAYLCTGTLDEVVWNTALASIGAAGGEILVSAGTYHFGSIGAAFDRTIAQGSLGAVKINCQRGVKVFLDATFTGHHAVNIARNQMSNGVCEVTGLVVDGTALTAVKPATTLGASTTAVANGLGAQSLQVASSTGYAAGDVISVGNRSQEFCLVQSIPDSTHLTVVRGIFGSQTRAHASGVSVVPMVTGLAAGTSSFHFERCRMQALPGDGYFMRCYDFGVAGTLNAGVAATVGTDTLVVNMPVDGNNVGMGAWVDQTFRVGQLATIGSAQLAAWEQVTITAASITATDANGNPKQWTLTVTRPASALVWSTGAQVQMMDDANLGMLETFGWDNEAISCQGNSYRLGTSLYNGTSLVTTLDNFELHRCYGHGRRSDASHPGLSGFYNLGSDGKLIDCHVYAHAIDGFFAATPAQHIELIGGEYENNGGTFYGATNDGFGIYCSGVLDVRAGFMEIYGNVGGALALVNACQKWHLETIDFHSIGANAATALFVGASSATYLSKGSMHGLLFDANGASGLSQLIQLSSVGHVTMSQLKSLNLPGTCRDVFYNSASNNVLTDSSLANGIVEAGTSDGNQIKNTVRFDRIAGTIPGSITTGPGAGGSDTWVLSTAPLQMAVGKVLDVGIERALVTAWVSGTLTATVTRGYAGTPLVSGSGLGWTVEPYATLVGAASKFESIAGPPYQLLYAASPTIDPIVIAQRGGMAEILLTGNIAPTISAGQDGQDIYLVFLQDGTGGWKVTWGAEVVNGPAIDATLSVPTLVHLKYSTLLAKWALAGRGRGNDGWQVFAEYTTNGTTSNVAIPADVTQAEIIIVGGGGGGGAGRKGAAGSVRCGGGGGAGGAINRQIITGAALAELWTVVVGSGGTGGTAATATDTSGNGGVGGGSSSVTAATSGLLARVGGGNAGSGGTASTGTGGVANPSMETGATGGAASTTGGNGGGGSSTLASPSGGGAGGGVTSADSASTGGAGGTSTALNVAGGAGGALSTVGTVGAAATAYEQQNGIGMGTGGGGGGASILTAGGTGGAGGGPGGGGGGGGAGLNAVANSGAGGLGAPGYVCIRIKRG